MDEKIKEMREKGYIIPDTAVSVEDDGSWMDAEGISHAAKKQGVLDKIPHGVIYGILALVIVIAAAALVWTFAINHTDQYNTIVTLEAGTEYVFAPEDYFKGMPDDVQLSDFTVDTSAVNNAVIGDYNVPVSYNGKSYTVTVHVVDTTAPELTVNVPYVITNSPADVDVSAMVSCVDATECTYTVGKFVKLADVQPVSDDSIKAYTDTLGTTPSTELSAREDFIPESGKLDINGDPKKDGETEITDDMTADEKAAAMYVSHEEDGIYSAVVTAEDAGGNTSVTEIIVVYDTAAPEITFNDSESAALLTDITVQQKDVEAQPEYDLQGAVLYDNADGDVTDSAELAIEETDGDHHVWTVSVKASDRAGNTLETSYKITVEKAKQETPKKETSSSGGSTGTGSAGTGSGQTQTEIQTPAATTTSSGVTYEGGMYVLRSNGYTKYWTDGEPSTNAVNWAKTLYNAGYWNPVQLPNGNGYGMIAPVEWAGDLQGAIAAGEYLENYVRNLGYSWKNGGGNNFGEGPNGEIVRYEYLSDLY